MRAQIVETPESLRAQHSPIVWNIRRLMSATVLLRIADHDSQRVTLAVTLLEARIQRDLRYTTNRVTPTSP